MKMYPKNKVYDVLKYVAQIGLPALATFMATVLPVWDVSDSMVQKIVITTVAMNTMLGALLLLSSVQYHKDEGVPYHKGEG